MSKKALVINKKDIVNSIEELKLVSPDTAFDLGLNQLVCTDASKVLDFKPTLLERSIAETNEDYLQIIPYITLVHLEDNGINEPDPLDDKTKFFVYTRGPIGNEGRLHGKCSVGLGGHIEEEPSENKPFLKVIQEGAFKELFEEAGLEIKDIPDDFNILDFATIFIDDNLPVERVHLCLSITFFINPNDIKQTEKDIITKGRWLTAKEIFALMDSENPEEKIELEVWSKMYFKQHIDNTI